MRPTTSGVMPAEPDPEESIEQLWEDYVSELTAILLQHLPDLWHVLHVRTGPATIAREIYGCAVKLITPNVATEGRRMVHQT